jgi:hypothetical protein
MGMLPSASLGEPGHARALRARPRKRPRHSRTRHGQPLRHHPLCRDDVPPCPGTSRYGRGNRAGHLGRFRVGFQDTGHRR